MLLPDGDGWRLSVKHHFGRAELSGDEAHRWLYHLLARVNRSGGSDRLVADAVGQIESARPDVFIKALAEQSERLWAVDRERIRRYDVEMEKRLLNFEKQTETRPINEAGLAHIPAARRLALEMALHESTEQQAVDGELAALELAWREAEEIAGIADDLLLPSSVSVFVERHRRDGAV